MLLQRSQRKTRLHKQHKLIEARAGGGGGGIRVSGKEHLFRLISISNGACTHGERGNTFTTSYQVVQSKFLMERVTTIIITVMYTGAPLFCSGSHRG